jgi:hypothetical protein
MFEKHLAKNVEKIEKELQKRRHEKIKQENENEVPKCRA